MESARKMALLFGVLFIITFITSIPALLLYAPVLDIPTTLLAPVPTPACSGSLFRGPSHHLKHRHRRRAVPDRQVAK